MHRTALALVSIFILLPIQHALAADFRFSFEWGSIELCTSGHPNRVGNPRFFLSDVPNGTVGIRFRLKDKNVPNYRHGGGTVAYHGQTVIDSGQFIYNNPCPPGGQHVYEWRAQAIDTAGEIIGTAYADRDYPE